MAATATFRDVILVAQDGDNAGTGRDDGALVWHNDYRGALRDFESQKSQVSIKKHRRTTTDKLACDVIHQRMQRYWQQFGFMTSTSTSTRFRSWYNKHVRIIVEHHHDAGQKNLVL